MRVRRLILLGGLWAGVLQAQRFQEPGHSIGSVSVRGNLILVELNEGVLGKANLFDLARHTLRFTPDGAGYRVENLPLEWDADFGPEMTGPQAALHRFAFPFSGKQWDAMSVGTTGSIAFGATPEAGRGGGRGGRGGGVTIGRFDQLQDAARALVNTVPAICVFFKPRMSGSRYFKEMDDRAVVTWSITEPYAGIQDFTWIPTVNRFQAVLRRDGSIDLSYDQLAARDAIVGVYPMVSGGVERALATIPAKGNEGAAAHLDLRDVKVSAVDGMFLKVVFETRGPVPAGGDAGGVPATYRVHFGAIGQQRRAAAEMTWTIRGGRGGRGGGSSYFGAGPGVSGPVRVNGNSIAIQGTLPAAIGGMKVLSVSAEVLGTADQPAVSTAAPVAVELGELRSPEVDLSAMKKGEGPFPLVYESFHYVTLPNPRDMTCTVIKALGDKFDFLAYYSDFRVDNQEAGTPSTGPLGGKVTGIGQTERGLASYCSEGRFQWQFVQPVFSGSNQMQERSPEGVIVDRAGNKGMTGYNLAMSQIGHEMGHRWAAFVSAKVNGETIVLGPTHWARGLQAQVVFPYSRVSEASAMGGGVWQDNLDGTFTQLDDDYYVPATGWSALDLYLMGLAGPSEVPDFFILRNLVPAGRDGNGRPIFKADRTKVTVQDVIAVEGPRLPDVEHSQRKFNTGMVMVVEHGAKPSKELLERTAGIREKWIEYFSITTGRRASMTAEVK